jgi:hypothetical protein
VAGDGVPGGVPGEGVAGEGYLVRV